MSNTIDAYHKALAADQAFSDAIHAAGFKGRWDMPSDVMRTHEAIRDAYVAKVMADNAFHACSIKA
jgi:hypothetical protein